jgi:Uncharacterised nucleotidyltransferase
MKSGVLEARLILLSAAPSSRRKETRGEMQHLTSRVDWRRLEAMLAARRLLALLGERIAQMAGEHAPARFTDAISRAKRDARRHGQFMQLVAARVTTALAAAGVPSLVLKGPDLGELLYGDAGYRMGSDIDVLVAAEDLPKAVAAAMEVGYERPSDPLGKDGLPLLHFTLGHATGRLPELELHWRVHWYERRFARDMLERSVPASERADALAAMPAADARVPGREGAPSPIDGFVSLLLYYARDGFIDVRLLSDVVGWWERFGEQLQPGSLDRTVREYPELRRALLAALATAQALTGMPARALVSEFERLDARAWLAVRLANPNPRQSLTQLHADVALVDWLLAPKGGQREFLHRQLLISREILEYHAMRAERAEVGTPLGHGGRVLARNVLAMPRLVRGARR